jgi:hypothetical protein
MSWEAQRMGWDDPSHTGEGVLLLALCTECGDPTDDPEGGPHAFCGTFWCPGECGTVIAVPALACAGCAARVAAEDEEDRRDLAAQDDANRRAEDLQRYRRLRERAVG